MAAVRGILGPPERAATARVAILVLAPVYTSRSRSGSSSRGRVGVGARLPNNRHEMPLLIMRLQVGTVPM